MFSNIPTKRKRITQKKKSFRKQRGAAAAETIYSTGSTGKYVQNVSKVTSVYWCDPN